MKFTINDFMPTERKSVQVLKSIRWPVGVVCVDCGSKHVVSNGSYKKHYHKYVCRGCGRNFTELTGTIFDGTKIRLKDWMYIIKEFANTTSKNMIHKQSGINYQTVDRIIDVVLHSVEAKQMLEKLTGEVIEIDGMYIPVGSKGTKQTKREPRRRGLKLRGRGTGAKDKPPIIGITVRGGPVKIVAVNNANKKAIDGIMKSYVVGSPVVNTDDFRVYEHLKDNYTHRVVNHSNKQYADGDAHTNTVEGLYSLLRYYLNTFRGVCKKNLQKFVSFFEFRHNLRDLSPMDVMHQLLCACITKSVES